MINNTPLNHPDAMFIAGVAFSTSEIILEVYNNDFSYSLKNGEEPVTVADQRADDFIVGKIKSQFPGDSIFSEENGLYQPEDCNNRIWFIDPIDGTKEFIKKNGEFAIQIGLAINGKLDFGLVYQPIGENLYIGAKGEGCHWHSPENGWHQLKILPKKENSLIAAISRSNPSELASTVHSKLNGTGVIVHGGVGLKLMAIARNKAHYYINDWNATKAWDMAAPELLFEEAGGVSSDLTGEKFLYFAQNYKHTRGLLSSCNASLHAQILEISKCR